MSTELTMVDTIRRMLEMEQPPLYYNRDEFSSHLYRINNLSDKDLLQYREATTFAVYMIPLAADIEAQQIDNYDAISYADPTASYLCQVTVLEDSKIAEVLEGVLTVTTQRRSTPRWSNVKFFELEPTLKKQFEDFLISEQMLYALGN